MFLELLEDKHFGKLEQNKVFRLANSNANFSNLWLVHTIRSNCSLLELALAVAANIKWNTPALAALKSLLNTTDSEETQLSSEFEQAITQSKEIINDFCEKEQKNLLIRLQSFTESAPEKTVLDSHKYTSSIPMSAEHVSHIVNSCRPHLKDVSLFGSEGKNSKNENIRNNSHFPTPIPNDSMALAMLERLLAKAARLPIAFAEPPVVLRYKPGQYYKWHYDYIYPHTKDIQTHIEQFGQRVKTAIFYCNDDFSGGETEFKQPFISVAPKSSKALVFDNCDELEKRDSSSIHRGTPVTSGEKWIVTLWFRSKPFWLRSGLL